MPSDRAWLSSLGPELRRQQEAIAALLDHCEASPSMSSLSVGCSIGRGVGDHLSDVDAAIGVHAPRGSAGAEQVRAVEEAVIALLPRLGRVIDVLRQESDGQRRVSHPPRLRPVRRPVAARPGRGGGGGGTAGGRRTGLRGRSTGRPTDHPGRANPRHATSALNRFGTGHSWVGAPCSTRTSTCDAARCGRPMTGYTRHGTICGCCGPPPARRTHGTASRRSWTTSRLWCRQESRRPWSVSTLLPYPVRWWPASTYWTGAAWRRRRHEAPSCPSS